MFSNVLKRSVHLNIPSFAINNVAVIGGGLMGSGIAQVTAQSGRTVTIVDQTDAILDKTKKAIAVSLLRIAKKKFGEDGSAISKAVSETMDRITFVTDPNEASRNVDLVVEAISEDLNAKRNLFKELDKVASPSTIFASNTSGFLVSSIAETTGRKDKFGGLHFFSPVPMMKLVEIITTPDTTDSTYETLREFAKSLGKVCVKCKDTPGFIVNRLLLPYVIQAMRMAERGDATIEDIDIAMKLGCGYPMGPFQLADFGGIDVFNTVITLWAKNYPEEPSFQVVKCLDGMIAKGHCGMKSGKGFYEYKK